MSDSMTIRLKNRDLVIKKLRDLNNRMASDSPVLKASMIRFANLIVSQAKLNIRKHGLIDEGRLLNSIKFQSFKGRDGNQAIAVGSFGVPYAAFWEFGFRGNMQVESHNRLITQAFGKQLAQARITRVRAHTRFRSQEAKSYLRPAYELHKHRFAEMMKKAMEG